MAGGGKVTGRVSEASNKMGGYSTVITRDIDTGLFQLISLYRNQSTTIEIFPPPASWSFHRIWELGQVVIGV
jgi:hypothetical protein